MTTLLQSVTVPAFILERPAAAILLPVLLGNTVGFLTRPDKTVAQYRALKQPPGSPPGWVFAPVWTALYAGMGFASYRAWTSGTSSFLGTQTLDLPKYEAAKLGATLYTIQLGLNLIWQPIFFGLLRPVPATVDIIALLGTTSYLTYVWSGIDDVATYLMLPYLGWLTFATYLSVGCGYLNNWDFKKPEAGRPKQN